MLDTKDIVDIQQLEAFCHHAVDHPDQSLLPLAFTQDAIFDASQAGGMVCEGIEAIQGWFALGKPPHPPIHHMTNCWVREEDGRVLVKMKWIIPDPRPGIMHGGENDDWVVRTDDGWRIKKRVTTLRYGGDFSASEALAK